MGLMNQTTDPLGSLFQGMQDSRKLQAQQQQQLFARQDQALQLQNAARLAEKQERDYLRQRWEDLEGYMTDFDGMLQTANPEMLPLIAKRHDFAKKRWGSRWMYSDTDMEKILGKGFFSPEQEAAYTGHQVDVKNNRETLKSLEAESQYDLDAYAAEAWSNFDFSDPIAATGKLKMMRADLVGKNISTERIDEIMGPLEEYRDDYHSLSEDVKDRVETNVTKWRSFLLDNFTQKAKGKDSGGLDLSSGFFSRSPADENTGWYSKFMIEGRNKIMYEGYTVDDLMVEYGQMYPDKFRLTDTDPSHNKGPLKPNPLLDVTRPQARGQAPATKELPEGFQGPPAPSGQTGVTQHEPNTSVSPGKRTEGDTTLRTRTGKELKWAKGAWWVIDGHLQARPATEVDLEGVNPDVLADYESTIRGVTNPAESSGPKPSDRSMLPLLGGDQHMGRQKLGLRDPRKPPLEF